jgi:hypothetical protein
LTASLQVIHTETEVASQNSDSHILRTDARRHWLALDLGELLAYREFLYFFVRRDIKVRYKLTVCPV